MNPDDLLAPSGDTIKISQWNVGDKVQGTVQAVKVVPETDWKTKEQKLSKNGNPLWQLRWTLEIDGENKALYAKGSAYYASINAIKASGIRRFDDCVGGTFALKREEDTPSQTPGFAPRKNYKAAFRPAAQ